MNKLEPSNLTSTGQAIEISVRLGILFFITVWCLLILMPFVSLIAWAAIIAIAIHAPFLRLTEKLGGRKKLAAALISTGSIAIVLIPVLSLSGSLVESASTLGSNINNGSIRLPAPPDSIRDWPLVGEKIYGFWNEASLNLMAVAQKYQTQLSAVGVKLLGFAASVSGGILQFMISMLIAGVFLNSTATTGPALQRFARRLAGDYGVDLLSLSIATIRSVAVGVLGIAFIQGVLAGLGMMVADVPAAGLIAFIVLVMAIAQLPPILVLAPVIFYVFSVSSPTVAIIFMIWSILVSMSDMVLKPLLLGRGVEAPMLVILMGAIGGMILSGIMGLFTGAVILALGYKLLHVWILADEKLTDSQQQQAEDAA